MTTTNTIDRLKLFLWWCAGADVATLQACRTDHARFTALGMMVLVVPFLASVSFTFFLTQTFGMPATPALLIGLAWGFGIVFVLDRLILTFHRKGRREFIRTLPRFILALSLAALIGEPLLVRLFSAEIELELRRNAQVVLTEARNAAEARAKAEKDLINEVNREMQQRLDHLKTIRDEKESAVIGEIEGTVGSRIQGDGPAAASKKQAFADASSAYEQARMELAPRIEQNNRRLTANRFESFLCGV